MKKARQKLKKLGNGHHVTVHAGYDGMELDTGTFSGIEPGSRTRERLK
jgi:hypothetical protein